MPCLATALVYDGAFSALICMHALHCTGSRLIMWLARSDTTAA